MHRLNVTEKILLCAELHRICFLIKTYFNRYKRYMFYIVSYGNHHGYHM